LTGRGESNSTVELATMFWNPRRERERKEELKGRVPVGTKKRGRFQEIPPLPGRGG